MRSLQPLLIGVVATLAGLVVAHLRDTAAGSGVSRRRAFVAGVWAGVVTTGAVLLAIGWWAAGLRIHDAHPAMLSSIAYVGAAIELFLGGLLATQVIRPPARRINVATPGRRPPR